MQQPQRKKKGEQKMHGSGQKQQQGHGQTIFSVSQSFFDGIDLPEGDTANEGASALLDRSEPDDTAVSRDNDSDPWLLNEGGEAGRHSDSDDAGSGESDRNPSEDEASSEDEVSAAVGWGGESDDLYGRAAPPTASRYLYGKEDAAAAGVRWGPRITFLDSSGQQFTLWRALLLAQKERLCSRNELLARARQLGSLQRWAVLMCRAGHFSGALFECGKVAAHKSFHRYVVRAKQGGRQSEKGEGAKSAGASLRRYNEAALDTDIRDLLRQWAGPLRACNLIFLQAPGAANSRPFFEGAAGKPAVLERSDLRLRPLPFPTKRPTYAEAQRCAAVLADLKFSPVTAASGAEVQGVGAVPAPIVVSAAEGEPEPESQVEPENGVEQKQELGLDCTAEDTGHSTDEAPAPEISPLYDAVRRGNAQAVQELLEKLCDPQQHDQVVLSEFLHNEVVHEDTGIALTPLHRAALSSHCAVLGLLLEAGADPTRRTAKSKAHPTIGGKVPYELANEKPARNVFRRAMADAPDRWDWVRGAMVPGPLTAEDEEKQRQKKLEKEKKLKAKKKNRKNGKAETEKKQAIDEDDAVLEVALGEKRRLLTVIERKREDAMGQELARRLQEEEWAAADAGAAAVSRTHAPAHVDGDAELAAAIALSLGGGGAGVAIPGIDLRAAQDQEYAAALARDLQRQTEAVRASTASGDEELRLMRERRARAAETRLNQQQVSATAEPILCHQCGVVLSADRFSRDEYKFCSTSCVRKYAGGQ